MHRTQTGKGVTSDKNQANAAKFTQIDLVDSLQNKVRDQTKCDTILVGCRMLVATTTETKAHVYLFGQQTSLVRIYSRHLRSNTERQHSNFVLCHDIQKHFPDCTKEVRIT